MTAIRGGLSAQSSSKGAGLRILTETVASPTLAAQIQQVLSLYPSAKWIQWEPVNRDNARAGARAAFGQYVEPLYDLTKSDVILSLDADFLSSEGAHNLNYMRQFATRRRVEEGADNLNRLYVVESDHTVTGGKADHRLPIKSSQIEAFARAVAAGAGVSGVSGTAPAGATSPKPAGASGLVPAKRREPDYSGYQRLLDQYLSVVERKPLTTRFDYVKFYKDTTRTPRSAKVHATLTEVDADINAGHVQMLVIVGESKTFIRRPPI
jgi:molybdopterin-containing oxidoreductase family iron-sulfur binding subunit